MAKWAGWKEVNWFFVVGVAAVTALVITCSLPAKAAPPITVSWEAPTTYEDGLILPLSEIGWFEFDQTLNGEFLAKHTVAFDATSMILSVKYRGTHCFIGYTVTVDGLKSGPSNEACKDVTSGNPNPPKNVGVQ